MHENITESIMNRIRNMSSIRELEEFKVKISMSNIPNRQLFYDEIDRLISVFERKYDSQHYGVVHNDDAFDDE